MGLSRSAKIATIGAALIAGIAAAEGISAGIGALLEDPNVRLCVESGGRKITDKPISEGLARIIGKECAEELRRESIIWRYRTAYPVRAAAIIVLVSLFDPITLVIAALLAAAFGAAGLRVARHLAAQGNDGARAARGGGA